MTAIQKISISCIGLLTMPFLITAPVSAAVIAKAGTTEIQDDQMRADVGFNKALMDKEMELYLLKRRWTEQKVREAVFELAAKDAGLPRTEWQAKMIDKMVKEPAAKEVKEMVEKMQGHTPDPTKTPMMEQQAQRVLQMQARQKREEELYQDLKKKYNVAITLPKPQGQRAAIPITKDNPARGPENARVTIVEFTDFQCPWCARSQDTLHEVEKTYKGKVRVVARSFPLTQIHPRAYPSAEAALCARDQGKYWEFRDKLFSNQNKLEEADYKQYAKDLKLKTQPFEQCLADHRHKAEVDADLTAGQQNGVRGTPSFFVNGIQAGFNDLSMIVQMELE